MDWVDWHEGYDLSPARKARLLLVQQHILRCLESFPPGPIRIISVCAGDARDLIGALSQHRRTADVRGWLVELNEELVATGQGALEEAGISEQLMFVVADATLSSTYVGFAPADVVLLAGVFGNLLHAGIPQLIRNLSFLCQHMGFVIWTRHCQANDGAQQVHFIRKLFRESKFEEVQFDLTSEDGYGIGTHCYLGSTVDVAHTHKLFEFVGFDAVWRHRAMRWSGPAWRRLIKSGRWWPPAAPP